MKSQVIVTYNGVDGACSAAVALLKMPGARVLVTSARKVGQTLQSLLGKSVPKEVHVCGVGASCPWSEVTRACRALKKKGCHVVWYCGRHYLLPRREEFDKVCSAIFAMLSCNADAVSRYLKLRKDKHAEFLLGLAEHDAHIGGDHGEPPTAAQGFWLDLINASVGEYFKYQDAKRYITTIKKLAKRRSDADDEALVQVYRRSGLRYALQGRSKAIKTLRQDIRRCASFEAPVLILGESGVGKEYVARLIHERSSRYAEPLSVTNCAAFAGNAGLANSTLFGHVKGAFTGATRDRAGAFRSASGGVLFLDELGELPAEVQAKLLRVVEDGFVLPEGADQPEKVDVRIIAATNRNLQAGIRDGKFRADLYHRLNICRLQVPPLREHLEDLEAIADSTIRGLVREGQKLQLSAKDKDLLKSYDWPGNVRQLKNLLARCAYMGTSIKKALQEAQADDSVQAYDAASGSGLAVPAQPEQVVPMEEVRRRYAGHAVKLCRGNLTEAATRLGVSRDTLRNWVRTITC